ncbi:MAG: mandelate racemase, partial [Armatimonadetes bacterium]|nr:mandelate racemase [Armatimonadota bacterium]
MRIRDVVLVEVTGQFTADELQPAEPGSRPLQIYPEFAPRLGPWHEAGEVLRGSDVFLEVHTDEGPKGFFGPVDGGHAIILRREMREFLIGRDPLAIEKIWDLLLRRNRHARAGYYMMAMSALDCALWDLKGKVLGQPVYRLLGGPTQEPVRAYASMLGFSLEPEALTQRAKEYQQLGYRAQKWFFRHGPADGPSGAARNVEVARLLRETLGDDTDLMFDAFNSWTVPYAIDMGQRIAQYRPAWLEEPVPVDRKAGLKRIRERTGLPIATGEHVYTRWQVLDLLEADAVDVVQADPDWCGGISELVKIANVCSAFDVPVCPHGHSLHAALHVAAALPQNVLPLVELLILHQRTKQRFLKGYLEPTNGTIKPPEAPGLG